MGRQKMQAREPQLIPFLPQHLRNITRATRTVWGAQHQIQLYACSGTALSASTIFILGRIRLFSGYGELFTRRLLRPAFHCFRHWVTPCDRGSLDNRMVRRLERPPVTTLERYRHNFRYTADAHIDACFHNAATPAAP